MHSRWSSHARDRFRAFSRIVRSSIQTLEQLETRRFLAAHIVGNATNFATIQAAVDAASAGQTVTVDPGNYPETVSIFKQLTVKGAQAGNDGRSNARGTGESIVTGADGGI